MHHLHQLYYGPSAILRPWYTAPFPAEYHRPDGKLWMCDRCLRYWAQQVRLERHVSKCSVVVGEEVYREPGRVSVMRVDGAEEKPFAQSLCLLAKLFLDHKTLYYDTESFHFYVLYEHRRCKETGLVRSQIVGYFSKEKQSPSGYNLSCILVMPHRQRFGYGSLLIDLSYKLVITDNAVGTPEKPLSDLGLLAYCKYWRHVVTRNKHILVKRPDQDGVKEVSMRTGMTRNDVMACLESLGVVWRTVNGLVLIKPDLMTDTDTDRIRLVDPSCLL